VFTVYLGYNGVMSKKLSNPVHLHVIATADVVAAVDLWRARRQPPPNRSDAIRTMLLEQEISDPMKKIEGKA
jgi:hypothetical protein